MRLTSTVRLREGIAGVAPNEVTTQTGASKPGLRRLNASFVAETKGTLSSLQLRPIEEAKIDCAKKLFASLHSDCVIYEHVNDFQTLLNRVMR